MLARGVTFFIDAVGRLYGIHGHTQAAPSAIWPVDVISRRARTFVCWVYVPIATDDQVLVVAIRDPSGFERSFLVGTSRNVVSLRPNVG
jgi:hypothetical protein